MTDRFVDPAVAGERFDRLRVVVERSALRRQPRPASGASRRSSSRARARRTRRCSPAARRQHRLVHFTPPRPLRAGTYADGRDHRRRAAPPHGRASSSCSPSRRTASRIPVAALVTDGRPAGRRRSGRRHRASRTSRWPPRGAVAGHRDRRRRRHAGVPRHGHRHGQADAGRSGRGRATTASTSSMPTDDFTVTDYRAAYDAALADDRRRGRRCSSPAPGSTSPPCSTASTLPGQWPDVRADLEAEPDVGGAARPARRRSTRSPPARSSPPTAAASCGPSRSTDRQRPAVQLVRPGPRRPTRRPTPRRSGCAGRAPVLAERIEQRVDGDDRRRAARRGRAAARAAGLSRTARQALGYKELLDHLDGRRRARRGRRRDRRCAPASSPSARSGGSVATRAYAGSTSTDDPVAEAGAGRGRRTAAHDHDSRSPSTTASATTSSSRSTRRRRRPAGAGPRGCATAAAASAPTACWSASRADGYAARDGAVQRRRQPGRDERQRHPLLRPGARRAGAATSATQTILTDAGAAPRRRCGRPRTRTRSWPASTWARSASSTEPDGLGGHRRRPDRPVVHLEPRQPAHRRRRRRRRAPSTCSTLGRQVPARQPRDHRARPGAATPITMRVHERGAGITEACGTGACAAAWAAARWGLVDAGRRGTRRAHGRRRCESGARPAPSPATSR